MTQMQKVCLKTRRFSAAYLEADLVFCLHFAQVLDREMVPVRWMSRMP